MHCRASYVVSQNVSCLWIWERVWTAKERKMFNEKDPRDWPQPLPVNSLSLITEASAYAWMSFFLWLLWLKWGLIMRAPASIPINEWLPHPLLITYKVYPQRFILWSTNQRCKGNLFHQSISTLPNKSMEQCFCAIHKEKMPLFTGVIWREDDPHW